uniref:RxLR effector candidate protein n=1 Tax=Hyaloperonospora arabidopsidis (strain Emoy2) TaxID=559515 RepID=M4BA02_HYAAE|nr:RxLR effector candidate protein [Hyaloperonospora arabidopsidis Emoy2]
MQESTKGLERLRPRLFQMSSDSCASEASRSLRDLIIHPHGRPQHKFKMRLITFALMASTPTFAHSSNSTRIPRSLLTTFNLSASVRFPDGSYDSVHAKRLLGDLNSTLAEERASPCLLKWMEKARASPCLPGSMGEAARIAVANLVTAIHSHGQNLKGLSEAYSKKARSFEAYAIIAYLEIVVPGLLSEQVRTESIRADEVTSLASTISELVKKSLDGRDEFISTVRASLSKRQHTEITPDLLHDLIELVQDKVNTPGVIFKKLDIGGESTWKTRHRIGNPFASPFLGALIEYIKAYNEVHHKSTRLLDAFITGYGDERRVAHMLSLGRLSCIYSGEAQEMEKELFVKWLESPKTICNVLKILRTTATIDAKAFTVKGPLERYILDLNRRYSIPEEPTAKILHLLKVGQFSFDDLLKEVEVVDQQINKFLKFDVEDIEEYVRRIRRKKEEARRKKEKARRIIENARRIKQKARRKMEKARRIKENAQGPLEKVPQN